jgi:phospholipid transport system substrate-binding protein
MKTLPTLLVVSLFALVSSFMSNIVSATEISPYVVLENTGQQLFSRIAANQKELKAFPLTMRNIVEEELMPTIDYKYAAYKILGKHLRKTTPEQRSKFVESMRSSLVRTYANALLQYSNQQVIFEKEKPTNGKKIVSIDTKILAANKPDIKIAFKMRQNKKSHQWKVYDMVIEGISLLSSKQAELSRRIAKQGVDQVTVELTALAK